METEHSVLAAEHRFFTAHVDARMNTLEDVLADDFLLIEVMGGAEIARADLLAVVGSGDLRFLSIEPEGSRVRLYGTTAVVTGATRMEGRFGEVPFVAHSRD